MCIYIIHMFYIPDPHKLDVPAQHTVQNNVKFIALIIIFFPVKCYISLKYTYLWMQI